eukprot:3527991-Pleurochrysis_carterae.AAC.2
MTQWELRGSHTCTMWMVARNIRSIENLCAVRPPVGECSARPVGCLHVERMKMYVRGESDE